jgi:vancomycin permeability regulator SanA
LKLKVLLHFAVLVEIAATILIFINRSLIAHLPRGIASPQNLPLSLIVVLIISLNEISFLDRNRRFENSVTLHSYPIFFLISAFVLLLCSLYLPSSDKTATDLPPAFAYLALMAQLSAALVVALSRRPTYSKIFAAFVFLSTMCTLIGFVYTFTESNTYHGDNKGGVAVVLGASVWGRHTPSPILRGRLDEAIRLFESEHVHRIVATGGTKRFGTVESEVEAWYLRENGIPDLAIMTEHNTLRTSEQAIFVKRVVFDSLKAKRIIVVTDNWHLPRALLMCRWEGVPQYVVHGAASNYKMPVVNEIYFRMRESIAIQAFILFGV